MINVTNDRLKQCQLAMLQAFISVCDNLNLKYYLVEGTLLGAVRHRGFIPWDDDVDVAMPRCDYERFLHEAQALLPSYYFVQSSYSEPEYHANFAKIRDCRTTFVESSVRERPINHGVYIDIFPLDFVPQSQFLNQCVKIVDRFCMLRIARVFTLPAKKRNIIEKAVWVGARAFSNVCFPTLRHAIKTQRRLYIACKKGSIVTNYGSAWKEKERMPVEWYGEGTVLTFEGISVRVPVEYDKWLKQVYGNYMTPPPPEQQAGHHYTEFIDLERPYTEYIQQKKHKN